VAAPGTEFAVYDFLVGNSSVTLGSITVVPQKKQKNNVTMYLYSRFEYVAQLKCKIIILQYVVVVYRPADTNEKYRPTCY